MNIALLYQDKHTLVAVKPPGMPVQKDSSRNRDLTSELEARLKLEGTLALEGRLHLINRLDRPVGGLVLFAKTTEAARRYSNALNQGRIDKHYLAVVMGTPPENAGRLSDSLVHDKTKNITRVVDAAEGKSSTLDYRVLEHSENLTLVGIRLVTGRHHQIRVQFASRGLPLWGDAKYGSPESGLLALWSHTLSFPLYGTKQTRGFTAWPAEDETPWNHFHLKEI